MPGMVAVGDNGIDRYSEGLAFPGGNAVNVAVWARRSGLPSAYVGVVGDDRGGALIRTALESEQVDLSRLRVRQGTTCNVVIDLVDGDRHFRDYDEGVSHFSLGSEDLRYIAEFDFTHTCLGNGLDRMEAIGRGLSKQLPLLAEASKVSLDCSDYWTEDTVGGLLPHVTVATFSASHMSENEVENLLTWAHTSGAKLAVAGVGPRGAIAYDGVAFHRARPTGSSAVVDTLGAGDAMIARIIAGLAVEEEVPVALQAAVQTAEAVCTIEGGFGYGFPM